MTVSVAAFRAITPEEETTRAAFADLHQPITPQLPGRRARESHEALPDEETLSSETSKQITDCVIHKL